MFVKFLHDTGAESRLELFETVGAWQGAFDAIERCRVPVIAACHGWCIGGGVNMIAACDIRVASAEARFSLREVKLAIVPDLGALSRLPRIIGEGMTRRLALTGEDIDADWALRCGLVDEVAQTPEACFEAARSIAQEIARNSPLAVRGTKRVLNEGLSSSARRGMNYVAAWNAAFLPSQDLKEAIEAFLEKRAPKFEGK